MRFIAECGLNHNGNHDLLFEMIKQAKRSGATDAKFQLGWRDKENEINAISKETVTKLIEFCDYCEINPLFSLIKPESYELVRAHKLTEFKIASRTVNEYPEFIQELLDKDFNLIISLGMWDEEHLPFGENPKINYLWCKSLYPTLPNKLDGFPKDFKDSPYSGFSDHTLGIETALLSITRGAEIIEKHFTFDKSDSTIRDHVLSATPEEFLIMTQLGIELHRLNKLKV